jgi:N-acetyl sugar amidotransferase
MKYCSRCVIPDTRPGIRINEAGVCSACEAHDGRRRVDWAARRQAFEAVARSRRPGRGYDCVIPVSGGKDSTWQVVTCLEHGLHPLAVTWRTPARTELGSRNLANLIALGVDHIDFQINPRVERRFLSRALAAYGSTAIPMHMALFAIPMTVAVRFNIPLVVWGENSADEYAGEGDDLRGARFSGAWLRRFGVTHGTTAEDWIFEDLSERDLTPYFGPTDSELEAAGTEAIFLGYYFPWDPATSFEVASRHGFAGRAAGPKTGYYDYADVDDDFISIHHYLKWYKFGFTRAFDNLSLEIRNGRVTRADAIEIIRQQGAGAPTDDIRKFCEFVGMTEAQFFETIEPFRNRSIWHLRDGQWRIDDFLIPDWIW